MVQKANRSGGQRGPRAADGRGFEVFVREEEPEPMRHVGTVVAPTPDAAHEEASKLFAWYARDVWVCPAAETYRYTADPFITAADDHAASAGEPRVYEETEGTPTVRCGGPRTGGVDIDSDGTGDPRDDSGEGADPGAVGNRTDGGRPGPGAVEE